nr:MAG TPA: hypothetical protein [Bacteriophage sp.]
MKLTFDSTGEVISAGGTSTYHYPIASGVPQNVTLSDMLGVTSLSVRISRNGVAAASAQMVIYEGMTFNLSSMALALPPLNALPIVPGAAIDVTDVVTIVATQNGVPSTTLVQVVSLACENIGGMIGSKYGKNLYTGGVDSFSGLTAVSGAASTLALDGLLGTFVSYTGNKDWNAMCFSETINFGYTYGRIVWTAKVKATGEHPILVGLFGANGEGLLARETVMPNEMKRIEHTIDSKTLDRVIMYVHTAGPTESPNQCVISEFGIYPNAAPPQWTPARMVEDSPYVGYLTDYRDGWSRKPFDHTFAKSAKSNGSTMSARILFKERSKTFRAYPNGNVELGAMFNGYPWQSMLFDYSIYNTNGSLYGCMRWKDDSIRQPPSCRVQLRWLNTKGAYDFMLFDTYKVVPVMNKYNTGGNSVDYYDVTVQRDIDGINDDALLQLTKSSEVNAILPDDCNQWGTATVVGNNTYSKSAGSTTQIMTIKLKVTL